MPIHRTIKNVVHNYTYAEVKVREATSNDPWGPPTALMSEIAQLTNNPLAYNEVMAMIWRRMNDHGKNWRHVYKSLMLLEYLMKHGSERVARECRANIVAIRTLADFQHVDENGRDNGMSVREKARQMAILLGDDERLRSERIRAHESRERFGGNSSSTRDGRDSSPVNFTRLEKYPVSSSHLQATEASRRPSGNPEADSVRPTTTGEEELQLQLALALSKEEHEEELKRQKADDLKLQMAIEESKKTALSAGSSSSRSQKSNQQSPRNAASAASSVKANPPTASLLDGLQDPWATPAYPSQPVKSSTPQRDPWAELLDTQTAAPRGGPSNNDPWSSLRSSSPVPVIYADVQRGMPNTLAPWEEVEAKMAASNPPPTTKRGPPMFDTDDTDFAALSFRPKNENAIKSKNGYEVTSDLFDMSSEPSQSSSDMLRPVPVAAKKVTPEQFLGANAKLVDFDDLVSKPTPQSNINPFAMTVGKPSVANPFVVRAKEEEQTKRVPINQLSASSGQMSMASSTIYPPSVALMYGTQPVPPQHGYNPFL